jgi:hypothetical protein
MKKSNGYEYVVVGFCKKTGRPFLAPIAWNHPVYDRPVYATCSCCGGKR